MWSWRTLWNILYLMEVSFIFTQYWTCDEPLCAKINLCDIVHCVDCQYQISWNPFFRDVMLCCLVELHIHCGWMYCSNLQGKSKKTTILRKQFFTTIIYSKPTRCNSGSIVFINNCRYVLHVLDTLCVHHQEHYKL